MVQGAVHPNSTNFRKVARLDIVERARRLCKQGLLQKRPDWLEWCERVPPMENQNLHLQARTIRNPYPQMVGHLLKKYPDLRFQDCYVDGNDWSVGMDAYRDDHPVMQFVARQLDMMRTDPNLSKKEAFAATEELFRERRRHLEREQKVMMAMAVDAGVSPMFSTGKAYLEAEKAKSEAAHLQRIRRVLRGMRTDAQAAAERRAEEEVLQRTEDGLLPKRDAEQEMSPAAAPSPMRQMREKERYGIEGLEMERRTLVGEVPIRPPDVDAARGYDDDETGSDASRKLAEATALKDERQKEDERQKTRTEEQDQEDQQISKPPADRIDNLLAADTRSTGVPPPTPTPEDDVWISPRSRLTPKKSLNQLGSLGGFGGVVGEDKKGGATELGRTRDLRRRSLMDGYDSDEE